MAERSTSVPQAKFELRSPTFNLDHLLSPAEEHGQAQERVSRKQLHHLLRLSALPMPANQQEEDDMMETLAAQLHFVQSIQEVDTSGVRPLASIRDETLTAERENTITMDDLKDTLESEEDIGIAGRRRRATQPSKDNAYEVELKTPLDTASRRTGSYFVVEIEPKERIN